MTEIRQEDLHNIEINEDMAVQAMTAAREKLEGYVSQHVQLEQRAIGLLKIFITLGMATLGLGIALAQAPVSGAPLIVFVAGAVPLYAAAAFMLAALWGREYGSYGGDLEWWMRHGIIDSKHNRKAYMNANLAFAIYERARRSNLSNQKALRFIHLGLICGLLAPAVLGVAAFHCS